MLHRVEERDRKQQGGRTESYLRRIFLRVATLNQSDSKRKKAGDNAGLSRKTLENRLNLGRNNLFELNDVGREFANTFSSLLHGHRVFVEGETKAFLIEAYLLLIRLLRLLNG